MSVSGPKHRRFTLVLGVLSTAAIAACDSHPTQPSVPLARHQVPKAAIGGDTASCHSGWSVIDGVYVCNPE